MAYISFLAGSPAAIITGGDLNNYIPRIFNPDIHRRPIGYEKPGRKELVLSDDATMFPLPSHIVNRHGSYSFDPENIYVAGPNRCGKSRYIAHWLSLLRQIFPDIPIYVFSLLKQDALLDSIPGGVIRVDINDPSFIKTPPSAD